MNVTDPTPDLPSVADVQWTEDVIDAVASARGHSEVAADPVVALLAAAASPAHPHELAGEDAAVAAFRAAFGGRVAAPALATQAAARSASRRRRFIALAAVGGVFVGASAAAATGSLPDPVQRVVHDRLESIGVHVPAPEGDDADGTDGDGVSEGVTGGGDAGERNDDHGTTVSDTARDGSGEGHGAEVCATASQDRCMPDTPATDGGTVPGEPGDGQTGRPADPGGHANPGGPADPGVDPNPGGPADPGNGDPGRPTDPGNADPGRPTDPGGNANPGGTADPPVEPNPGGPADPGGGTPPGRPADPGGNANPGRPADPPTEPPVQPNPGSPADPGGSGASGGNPNAGGAGGAGTGGRSG